MLRRMEPGRRLPVGAKGMRPFYIKTPREDCAAIRPDGHGIGCAVDSSNCDLLRKNCGQVSCSVAWGYQKKFSLQFGSLEVGPRQTVLVQTARWSFDVGEWGLGESWVEGDRLDGDETKEIQRIAEVIVKERLM
jgi:hypothetical protein